jgi:hypothetical protein
MNALFLKGTLFSILLFVSLLSISCGGGGGDSSPAPAPSPSDTTAPSIPGSLIANTISTGQIDLSWNVSTDNTGVTGYKIYRDSTYMLTVTSNSRSDTGLANNQNYCYRVSAVDARGNESGQSNQSCATTHASWTRQWGSAAADVARGIVRDSSGNTYVSGIMSGDVDGQLNVGGVDAFLTKYDSSGVRQWTRLIGTTGADWGQAVDVDSAGNIYVTGYVSGSFAGKTYYGETDIFLAKYAPSGNLIWYQQWGTATKNEAYGVKVAGTSVYVAGHTYQDVPGDTIPNTIPNIFLSKRNTSDGSEIWTILDGTPNQSDYLEGIALDSGGNIYLAGYTHGDFGAVNAGGYDIFLAKYLSSGDPDWVRQWGSTVDDFGRGVAVDGSNNIYVTGSAGGSIGGAPPAGSQDIFLSKYNTLGAEVWPTKLFGTAAIDSAYGIAIDGSGNIYLTGLTQGNFGGAHQGAGDVFLMRCDTAGIEVWTEQLGTAAGDAGYGAAFNSIDGFIYVTGYTLGALDGNMSAGNSDALLLKYDAGGTKQ